MLFRNNVLIIFMVLITAPKSVGLIDCFINNNSLKAEKKMCPN